jgi:hypothetical protein
VVIIAGGAGVSEGGDKRAAALEIGIVTAA